MIILIKQLKYLLLFVAFTNASALRFHQPIINDGFANRSIWTIAKDQKGFVWFATTHNVLRYDGYEFEPLSIIESISYKKRTLHADSSNTLWIGTEYGEIFSYFKGQVSSYGIINGDKEISINNNDLQINRISSDNQNNIYIASNNGLYSKKASEAKFKPMAWEGEVVKDVYVSFDQSLYVTNNHELFLVDNHQKNVVVTFNDAESPRVIHETTDQQLNVGTNLFLYKIDEKLSIAHKINAMPSDAILSMASNKEKLWVGTLVNGMYAINRDDLSVIHKLKQEPLMINGLSDDLIIDMLLDDSGVLFLGTFDGDINITNVNTVKFGLLNGQTAQLNCLKSQVIYHIFEDDKGFLWLSTANGIVRYSKKSKECIYFGSNKDKNSLSYPEIRSINQDKDGLYWISTNNGLNVLNFSNRRIDRLTGQAPPFATLFSFEYAVNKRIVGTKSGLFIYDTERKSFNPFKSKEQYVLDAEYFAYAKDQSAQYYFATSAGLVYLSENQLESVESVNQLVGSTILKDVYINTQTNLMWLSTQDNGLFKMNLRGELIKHMSLGNELPLSAHLLDILEDDNGHLWVSSLNGLYRIHINNYHTQFFGVTDGLQGNTFKRGASFKNKVGKLYFGGLNGLNGFYPEDIFLNDEPPEVVLTKLTRFNKTVIPKVQNGDFSIQKPIDELEILNLGHQDYIFGFEYAALDFADSKRNQYAYFLDGFDKEWNHANAQNRRITYTNLNSGTYSLMIKASNKDGVWSEPKNILTIKIKPAPWYSWWAFLCYAALFVFAFYSYIQRKIRLEKIVSKNLKKQVTQQTERINQQNEVLASLMARKNELFANISHEFRTPLTLILGPIQGLINNGKEAQSLEALKMVNRNANKLLSLVDHLLLLAKFTEKSPLKKYTQEVDHSIKAIVATFEYAAQQKRQRINLLPLEPAYICVTHEALEIILGNLLSNAIKYTPVGGCITVGSIIKDQHVIIYVEDTGPGIAEEQKSVIFERFKRLNHSNTVDGVGIGLALIEEVAKANDTEVILESKVGHGSKFSVRFKITGNEPHIKMVSTEAIQRLSDQINPRKKIPQDTFINNKKATILIIEDNQDMQLHIKDILKKHFNCLVASNGQHGIARALEFVPDIILCDVMMPEMDGFEVCRLLRSDGLTSHIPLVLLTALDDKNSRIKGWKEHVDTYLTKPFDAEELIIQLSSILDIRSLLRNKTHHQLVDHKKILDLPELDARFVEKLRQTVKSN